MWQSSLHGSGICDKSQSSGVLIKVTQSTLDRPSWDRRTGELRAFVIISSFELRRKIRACVTCDTCPRMCKNTTEMQFESRIQFRLRRIFSNFFSWAGREVNSHTELNVTILQHVSNWVCVSHVTKRPAELRAATPKIVQTFGPSKNHSVPSTDYKISLHKNN